MPSESEPGWSSRDARQAHIFYLEQSRESAVPAANTAALYARLEAQIGALLGAEHNWIANAANIASLIYHGLPDLNWVGFYFVEGDELVLGPFQGRPACTRLGSTEGACGKAVTTANIVRISDVNKFAGHIACDPASRSELVVPLIEAGRVIGVLDLDSPSLGRFTKDDEARCVALAKFLTERLPSFGNVRHIDLHVAASKYANYNVDIMDDAADDLNAAANDLGLSKERAFGALKREAAEAARETTGRAKAKPRRKPVTPAPAAASSDLGGVRLRAAYETLVRKSDLKNSALSESERLTRANHLVTTYNRLRKHDPNFRDKGEQLREARRVRMVDYRRRKNLTPEAA